MSYEELEKARAGLDKEWRMYEKALKALLIFCIISIPIYLVVLYCLATR